MPPRPVGFWVRGFDPRARDMTWTRDGFAIEVIRYDISHRMQTRYTVIVRGLQKKCEAEFFVDDTHIDEAEYKLDELIDQLVEKIENAVKPVNNKRAVLAHLAQMARAAVA